MLGFLSLVPNGRFSPSWAYIPTSIMLVLIVILTSEINGLVTLSQTALSVVSVAAVTFVLIVGGMQIYRFKWDSTIVERQQTKWILLAIVIFTSGVVSWILIFGGALTIPDGSPRLLANLAGTFYSDFFALPLLPIVITIAILRYNLWGIDVIIRKTLIYAVLTLLLTLVYFGMIVLLQSLFDTVSGQQSPLAIVISTLVIAALFAPLRRRVQIIIDRRFFRRQYNVQQVLAEFALTARDETDVTRLRTTLLQVVQETMQPKQVTLWLREEAK